MRVPRDVLDAITAHARRDHPRECCGLLIGTATDVLEAVATGNIAADPLRRYEVAPAEHFAQVRRCRESTVRGLSAGIVGVYHSHPHSAPEPSPTDLDQAFGEFLYVIAGPVAGAAPLEIRGYRLRDTRLEEVALVVTPR